MYEKLKYNDLLPIPPPPCVIFSWQLRFAVIFQCLTPSFYRFWVLRQFWKSFKRTTQFCFKALWFHTKFMAAYKVHYIPLRWVLFCYIKLIFHIHKKRGNYEFIMTTTAFNLYYIAVEKPYIIVSFTVWRPLPLTLNEI